MENRIRELWAEYEPRIRAAREAEGRDRNRFFCDDLEDEIGDFPAVVLTLERYLLLTLEGVFGEKELCDPRIPVLRLLWIVSPNFQKDPAAAAAFIRKHRAMNPAGYAEKIADYIGRAFEFSPARKTAGEALGDESAAKEWVSAVVDTIASEYGWRESAILGLPLPRIFLYVRRIHERHNPDGINFCKEADRLQAEFMDRANGAN